MYFTANPDKQDQKIFDPYIQVRKITHFNHTSKSSKTQIQNHNLRPQITDLFS